MKNQLIVLGLALASISPSLGFAAPGEAGPCKEIRSACEAAGFVKGNHKKDGKGLWVDCMKKVKAGEAVPGVNVTPEQVTACKDKAAKRHAKKSS